ncbi:MAG TPA: vWA domain-containing protein [Gaiellaceae bacterium]|jgi:hypothetical protein
MGISFLTPAASLFALAALVPLGALVLAYRRARHVHTQLRLPAPPSRRLVAPVAAIVALGGLVAAAAAQPIVVHRHDEQARTDAQVFIVFDTSTSMRAAAGAGAPIRLVRAKRLAIKLERSFPDIPFGVVSMTDRALPNLMPTVDRALFDRAVRQSIAINRPPPSQPHRGRATTFDAIVPLVQANFFPPAAKRRVLIVFTDGEATPLSPLTKLSLEHGPTPLFVHVWQPDDRIRNKGGSPEGGYTADRDSAEVLADLAAGTAGHVYTEKQLDALKRGTRRAVGTAASHTLVSSYARVPLAEWFILAAVAPLGFLLWRRNL